MSVSGIVCNAAVRCAIGVAMIAAGLPGTAAAQSEIVLNPSAPAAKAGQWTVVSDSTAIGGKAIRHADAGAAKLSAPLASPSHYLELTFDAAAGTPYRIWLRGKADKDHYANDSVFMQFSGSVTSSGSSTWRIGTTSATEMNLEECSGCGLKGWAWQDNGWGKGVLGPVVYFATTGPQRMRIQTREDGLSLDQIVLSSSKYLTSPPATTTTSTTTSSTSITPAEITLNPALPVARAGKWTVVSDTSAFGGKAIRHADEGAAKLTAALASPANYFELTFDAVAGTPYRLWLHGKADKDHYANDSVFVQFSGSVTSSGSATWRIGTTSATEVNLEECTGCGLKGWRWQDNGWGQGVLGPLVYFATTGPQRVRVQTREDGLSIDRILLSPATYLKIAPTTSATTTSTTTTTTTTSSTATVSPTTNILKVMTWNTAHGKGTDGVYNIERFIPHIVKSGANVVCLQEVEVYVSGYGNEDQPARYAAMLKAATGKTWYHTFAHRTGGTKGQGNVVLSIFPFEATGSHLLSYSRSVARAQILVNGIRVNLFSTHLDANSSSYRTTQMRELNSWAATFPEQRISSGDFNAWPGAGEISNMTSGHYDAWAVAKANGTAVAYAGNEAGYTRNHRIDYVFYSKGASRLVLKAAQVFDVRDSKGIMPSDHRPVMATFEVK